MTQIKKEYQTAVGTGVVTGMGSRLHGDSGEDWRDFLFRLNPHQKIPFNKVTDPKDRGWRDNTESDEGPKKVLEKRKDDITIIYPTEEARQEAGEKLREALRSRFVGPHENKEENPELEKKILTLLTEEGKLPIKEVAHRILGNIPDAQFKISTTLEDMANQHLIGMFQEPNKIGEMNWMVARFDETPRKDRRRLYGDEATLFGKSSVTDSIKQQGFDPYHIHAQDDPIGTEKPQSSARYPNIPQMKKWGDRAFKPIRDIDNQRFFPEAQRGDQMPWGEPGPVRDSGARRTDPRMETERYNADEDDEEEYKTGRRVTHSEKEDQPQPTPQPSPPRQEGGIPVWKILSYPESSMDPVTIEDEYGNQTQYDSNRVKAAIRDGSILIDVDSLTNIDNEWSKETMRNLQQRFPNSFIQKNEIVKQRDPHQWYQYSTPQGKKKILERVGAKHSEEWENFDKLPKEVRDKISTLFEEEHKKESHVYKEELRQNEQYGDSEGMLGRVGFNVEPKKDTDAKLRTSLVPREALKSCKLCQEIHEDRLECPLCKSEVCSDFDNEVFTCPTCVYSLVRIPNQSDLEIVVG